jgi:hypothetical protein
MLGPGGGPDPPLADLSRIPYALGKTIFEAGSDM